MRQHFFCRKLWYPLLGIKCFDTRTLWNIEKFLYERIRYCETKQFWRKVLVPGPSNTSNIFGYQKVSETRKSFPTNFSVVWDNTFSTTNRDPPPLSTKYFHTRKFLKHRKVPSAKVSGVFRQKIIDGKFWYSPIFMQKLFRYRTFSETQHRRIPLRKLSALRDKNFSAGNLDTPPFIHKPIS